MTQGMLDFAVARKRREDGIKRSHDAVSDDWKVRALAAVERTCHMVAEFISDDVWAYGNLEQTGHDRALGSVMLKAAKLGYCVKTDRMRRSRRSNLSGKPVWKSLIHGRSV
jgi:hypothetical protein